MRVETELRPSYPQDRNDDQGLRTERQIDLYRQREAAKREKAGRREAEARVREAEARARGAEAEVRHLNFGLVERICFFGLALAVGVVAILGALKDPDLLKAAVGAGALGGATAAARYCWMPGQSS